MLFDGSLIFHALKDFIQNVVILRLVLIVKEMAKFPRDAMQISGNSAECTWHHSNNNNNNGFF